MKLLCDTCVFGFIAKDKQIEEITEKISKTSKFIICKYDLIRKEVRGKKHKKANSYLTTLYDKLTRGKIYSETQEIKDLAEEYYKVYRKKEGNKAKKKILIDT